MDQFRAWLLRDEEDRPRLALERLDVDDLPAGDVLIEVRWSGVNYKDALAVTGRGKIARRFPLVPGIDLAGVVRESVTDEFRPGDEVLVNGWGIGETDWGGYGELARVPAAWVQPVPPALGMRGAMALGTAGLTAPLAVRALEQAGLEPGGDLPVLVTGASGGLGGVAVVLLAAAGFRVAALTGRPENEPYLRRLGAAEIVPREELQGGGRPLESQRWAGAVDVVGGEILARALAQTADGGSVAACGLAGDARLETTVMPFILRGVSLLGINAVFPPMSVRREAWERLARQVSPDLLEEMIAAEVPLEDVPQAAEDVLAGRVRGRVVVEVGA